MAFARVSDNCLVDTAFAVTSAIGTANEIPFANHEEGSVSIPNGSSITTVTFWGCPVPGGEFEALYTTSNAAVAMTVAADRCYPFPASCKPFAAIKIVGNAAGTVQVGLKSTGVK